MTGLSQLRLMHEDLNLRACDLLAHKSRATEFCSVAPNMGWSSVRNLLRVADLAPGILKCVLDHPRICAPLTNVIRPLPQTFRPCALKVCVGCEH